VGLVLAPTLEPIPTRLARELPADGLDAGPARARLRGPLRAGRRRALPALLAAERTLGFDG